MDARRPTHEPFPRKKEEQNNTQNAPTFGMRKGGPGAQLGMPVVKPQNISKTIKRLLGYLKEDRFLIIIVFICVATNTGLNLLSSYMLRPIINNLFDGKGATVLVQNLIIMAIAYAVALIANFIQIRIMINVAQKSLERLRNDLFEKMQKLPLRYFDTNSNGDMMSRYTNDVDSVGEMMSNTAITLFSAIITFVGTLIVMCFTNIILTVISIVLIPIFFFTGKFITSKSRKYFKGRQETLGELNGFIEETITGQKVVKVFNHEEEAFEDFKVHNKAYKEKVIKAQFLGGAMGPVMGGMGHLSYVITAFIGGFLCLTSYVDVGAYAVFLNYSRNFTRPINEISMQMNVIYSALAGAERVFAMMDEDAEVDDIQDAKTPEKIDGYVKLNDVSFGYREDKLVLKNISLYAKPGQKITFVGSTGAGKTTITNLLNRFYDIQSGTITIDDIEIKSYKKEFLRQNIAMVLQDTHLYEGTVM